MSYKLSLLVLAASVVLAGCSPEPEVKLPVDPVAQKTVEQVESSVPSVSYEEGVHYRVVTGVDNEGATAPFIVEYFWLGCPHCQAFEAPLKEFISKNPNFSVLKKPAAGSARWAMDAKIYYGLKQLDKISYLDQLFDQYRDKPLPSKTTISEFLISIDVEPKAFFELVDTSPSITNRLNATNTEMLKNDINGVPGIVINGQYLVIPTRDVDFFDLVTYLSNK